MDDMAARYRKLIVDLDGTLYRGSRPLPQAVETMAYLREFCSVLFLSNNCNESAHTLASRLRQLGFEAHPHEVISSVPLMVEAVNELGTGLRILSLTSGDFERAAQEANHRITNGPTAEVVVVGVDLGVTYRKLSHALSALLSGAILIAANADATYPTEQGPRPAAGTFVGAFLGMGFSPSRYCGKPDPWAIRKALELRGIAAGPDCLLVGDRLDSDILGAHALSIDSALVLTGVSSIADVASSVARPTYTVETFAELREKIGIDGRWAPAGASAHEVTEGD
jgi:HAD superfamily hydrolase (TIGR01450 family)